MIVEGAALDLPSTDSPFELPTWPEVLPDIDPPLGLQADTIQIDDFRVSREGEHVIDIRRVRGGLDAREGSLHLEHVVVRSEEHTSELQSLMRISYAVFCLKKKKKTRKKDTKTKNKKKNKNENRDINKTRR